MLGCFDEDKIIEILIFMQFVFDVLIMQIKIFGGFVFQLLEQVMLLLILGIGMVFYELIIFFQIFVDLRMILISGWSQGVVFEYGKGCVVVFVEGMMFLLQLDIKIG